VKAIVWRPGSAALHRPATAPIVGALRACPMLLSALATAGCSSTTAGIRASQDPGQPDGRWKVDSARPLESATRDPGVVECKEKDRHSFERESHEGWSDLCGWRRHMTCKESFNFFLGTQRFCEDTTPVEVLRVNLDLHLRRVFTAGEACDEAAASVEQLEERREHRESSRETTWRVTGCGKRAHRLSPGCACLGLRLSAHGLPRGEQPRGHRRGPRAAPRALEPRRHLRLGLGHRQRAEPMTLPDGRPGLTVALAACDRTFLDTCVRPDLVPTDTPACREMPLDPAFVASALEQARVRVEKDHRCQLPATALTLIGERSESTHRSAVFRVTSCNPTRDVRTVGCRSVSLVDGTVKSCAIDDRKTERSLLPTG
jgi:hypothetical protein